MKTSKTFSQLANTIALSDAAIDGSFRIGRSATNNSVCQYHKSEGAGPGSFSTGSATLLPFPEPPGEA